MKFSLYEILNKTSQLPNYEDRIHFLRIHDNPALRNLLELTFDKNVRWNVPETIEYIPSKDWDNESYFYREVKKLYLFIEGAQSVHKLTQKQRDTFFIDMLEKINANDAILLLAVRNKKLPWKEITKKMVTEAFPGIL